MKDPHDIILRPVLTEKAYEGIGDKRYIFEVAEDGVKVEKVNTVRTLGKIKRQGKFSGRTPEVKKAYVTLKKDSKPIKFFEGMAQ